MNQEIMPTQFGTEQMELALNQQRALAADFSQAHGLIPPAFEGRKEAIFLAMQYGASVGLNPIASLQNINVIKGKPSFSGQTYAGLVRNAGHTLRIDRDEKHMRATCTIIRKDDPQHPYVSVFDMDKAKKAGLTSNPSYQKYPMQMLTWRAVTDCARMACSELFLGIGGAYTAEELSGDDPVTDTIEATVMDEDAQDVDDWGVSKKELAKRVSNIMANAGVRTAEEGALVVSALTGDTTITKTIDVDEDDLRNWLESEDMLTQRVQGLLTQIHEQQQAEEQATETNETEEQQ